MTTISLKYKILCEKNSIQLIICPEKKREIFGFYRVPIYRVFIHRLKHSDGFIEPKNDHLLAFLFSSLYLSLFIPFYIFLTIPSCSIILDIRPRAGNAWLHTWLTSSAPGVCVCARPCTRVCVRVCTYTPTHPRAIRLWTA